MREPRSLSDGLEAANCRASIRGANQSRLGCAESSGHVRCTLALAQALYVLGNESRAVSRELSRGLSRGARGPRETNRAINLWREQHPSRATPRPPPEVRIERLIAPRREYLNERAVAWPIFRQMGHLQSSFGGA